MTRTDRKINVFVNRGTLFLDVQFYLSAHVECTAELFELSLQLSRYVRISILLSSFATKLTMIVPPYTISVTTWVALEP
jgi:hypothetical protein